MIRILNPLVGLVARVPAPVQTKLLAAFLAIAALLVMVGAVGLEGLREVNQRTEELIKLQRKIEAYRQVQHDTTGQLYSVATALISSDEQTPGQHATSAQPVRLRRGPAGVRGQGRGRAPRAVPPRLRPFRCGGDAGRGADPRRPYRRGAGDPAATGQPARRSARAPDQPARQQGRGRHGLRHRGQHPRLRHGAGAGVGVRARQHRAGARARLCHLLVADRAGQADRGAPQPGGDRRICATRPCRQP